VKKLFGTDGVRGLAGEWPLVPEFVRRLGEAAATVLRRHTPAKRVLIVRDTRRSGPALLKDLAAGLSAGGFQAMDGGVLPTPSVAALVPRRGFAAGAVISASHNPAEFNGIKFFGHAGTKLPDAWEAEIEALLEKGGAARSRPRFEAWGGAIHRGARSVPFRQAAGEYVKFLKSTWPRGLTLKGFRMAVDCANGATGSVAAGVFRSLGAEVDVLSSRPNGMNINKGCGALHPENLAKHVRRRGLHLGAAFDGDGDRAIFVDEEGAVRDGDAVLLAAGRHLKAQNRLKKNTVVVTVMANLGLRKALEALGIRVVETPVGDKYVYEALVRTGAVLGGEQSGHTIFREFLPSGDGLLTALQVAATLRAAGRPFSTLAALAAPYPQVLLNVKVREKKPLETIDGFSRAMKAVEKRLGRNGRVLVRYSGTEPLLRIMLEGPTREEIERDARGLARLASRG